MKKILFIGLDVGAGGAERRMVTLACGLKSRGYNVDILSLGPDDFFMPKLKQHDVAVVWNTKGNILKKIWSSLRYIKRGEYDCVISLLATPNFINCLSGIINKKHIIITGESSAFTESQRMRGHGRLLRGKFYAWFERFADYLVCNSMHAAELWRNGYPQYGSKIKVIYNPVILGEITSKYIVRRNGRTSLVVAASFQKIKNVEGLIQGIALLDEEDKKRLTVDWYGDQFPGSSYEVAVEQIRKDNLGDIVHLHKATKQIADVMNQADVVGLFSMFEGLPNAICEALRIGKPIIMTRVSDYNTLVTPENGILCDWDKPETIKDALKEVVNTNNEDLTAMGESSRTMATMLFDNERILNKWIDLIKN